MVNNWNHGLEHEKKGKKGKDNNSFLVPTGKARSPFLVSFLVVGMPFAWHWHCSMQNLKVSLNQWGTQLAQYSLMFRLTLLLVELTQL